MKKNPVLTASLLLYFFVSAQFASAQDLGGALLDSAAGQNGAGYAKTDLPVMIGAGIKIFLGLLSTIFFFYTLYAGFLWMTAGGDDKKVGEAKNILRQAVVGLLILTSAYAITTFALSQAMMISAGVATPGM